MRGADRPEIGLAAESLVTPAGPAENAGLSRLAPPGLPLGVGLRSSPRSSRSDRRGDGIQRSASAVHPVAFDRSVPT